MKKEEGIVRRKWVKAILFDLDGVLVDSLNAWFHVFNDALRNFGFKKLSKNDFIKEFGAPIESDVKKYFKGKTIKQVEHFYNIDFKKRKAYVKFFTNSADVLKNLKKQKIKIGLITNSTKVITLTILRHFKLRKYFDVVMTMDDVKRGKPAPDMVLKACRMLKVKPRDTMLVGDTKNDMLAGKRAGCFTIGFKIKGDSRINSLRQILDIIN